MVAAPKKQIISWQSKIKAENNKRQMQISAESFQGFLKEEIWIKKITDPPK